MASEDVLEWAETSVGLLFDANYSEREALFIQNTIDRLAAEVRELRERDAQRDAAEGELLTRVEELRRDKARLDWLLCNLDYPMSYERESIDAAMGGREGYAMANSWLLNRLREINEQSKSWPAWVFEQPLTRRDAEKIARGERLRSPAPMASEDVLAIYDEMTQGVRDAHKSDWEDIAEALAAEVRELRRDKARLDWLEKQATPGLVWEARQSRTGRGYRLHQHARDYLGNAVDTGQSARSAIDAAMTNKE